MPRRHLIAGSLLVAIILGGGATIVVLLRQQEQAAAVSTRLPTTPDLSRWPAEFSGQIRDATNSALTARDSTPALASLARLYFVNGFDAQARQLFTVLREREPTNALWPYLVAESLRRSGDSTEVEAQLQATVKLAPDYFPAWLRLGDVQVQRNALDAARDSYTRAVALAAKDVRTRYALIAFEAHQGKRGSPLGELVELVKKNPGIAQLYELLGELFAAEGASADAERQHQLAANADRELETTDPWIDALMPQCFDATRVSLRAIAAFRERRLDDAEKLLRQAIALAPGDPTLRDSLSHVYEQLSRPADARIVLEKAVVDFPTDTTMRGRLARLLSREHRTDEAVAMLRAALQRWPNDSGLHGALGFTFRDVGKNSDALPEFREAVRLDPTFVEAHYQLAFCLLAAGQRDAARAAAEKALAMRPGYFDAQIFLASLALEAGDVASAEQHASRAYALQPHDPGARLVFATLQLLKGSLARDQGREADAENFFRAGLAANPDFAPLVLQFGALAAQRGELPDARDAFARHVRLEPDDPRAYVALGKVLLALGQPADARQILERGLVVAQKVGAQAQIDECRRLLK